MADTTPDLSESTDTGPAESSKSDTPEAGDQTYRVGVLSPHNSRETKAILNAIRSLGHQPVWLRDENVASCIDNGTVHLSPDVDVLVNRLLVSKSDTPLEDLQLAALFAERVPVLNPASAVMDALHKYRAGVRLAEAGLPVPDAHFARSIEGFDGWESRLGNRVARKPTLGTNGQGVEIATDGELPPDAEHGQSFVQEFLSTRGERPTDTRVYVVGKEVIGAMRRCAPEGEWRTNVALGAKVRDVTNQLGKVPRRLAVSAVNVLNLDIGGVDLMRADGRWHVLEVNPTAGFKGLYNATGISVAPHIAALAVKRAGAAIPADAIQELASTLDGSVPDCKPRTDTRDADRGVLGYTSRVAVTARDGTVSTIAKADTGARRTSIDTELAGRIGAGPMVGTTDVRSAGSGDIETRPLVDIQIRVDEEWRTVTASIADRSGMRYEVLLGRDVLQAYTLDISKRAEE